MLNRAAIAATGMSADLLRDALTHMLPHIKITVLLMKVDRWTGFTRHFTHLKTGEPAKDTSLLLTAILADPTNLGLVKMAEPCPGTSSAKLSWLVAWQLRGEIYSKALAEIVIHQGVSSGNGPYRTLRLG